MTNSKYSASYRCNCILVIFEFATEAERHGSASKTLHTLCCSVSIAVTAALCLSCISYERSKRWISMGTLVLRSIVGPNPLIPGSTSKFGAMTHKGVILLPDSGAVKSRYALIRSLVLASAESIVSIAVRIGTYNIGYCASP